MRGGAERKEENLQSRSEGNLGICLPLAKLGWGERGFSSLSVSFFGGGGGRGGKSWIET